MPDLGPDAALGVPLPRHELVRHDQALGPVQGLPGPITAPKPGHEQRLRGRAIRVQALKPLFHNNQRIRAGEVFTLVDPSKFKSGQMVEVTDERPPKDTREFAPDAFPFPKAAAVKRGIPGMPRTAQGTRPTLDPRAGLAQPDDEALGADPDKLLE
jgi:hypothetical protein